MSTEMNDVKTEKKLEVNAEKRAFMKKFGKYAVVSAGMATLMTPTKSSAGNYGGGNTGGGGGHCNPGSGGSGILDWFLGHFKN